MSLREGLIVDRYVVEHPIGRGGTAEVWCVRHRTLGTRRALKVLSLQRVDLHARLLEEGRAQARLSSEHIVPVLDVLDIEGAPALVMPLIEGPSLAQLLEVYRPSEAEVAAIMLALLDGVQTAHAAGFVHRDLKPANVLLDLTSGGVQPRIADFGIARSATSDVTQTGAVLGTPAYAAPEQLRDTASVDARADFWSLGVILYQLLSGRLPFRADDLVLLVHAMETETPEAPSGDPRWTELVRDLLRARREERLCDVEKVRNRIDAISPPTDRSPLGAGTQFATATWRIRAREPERAATILVDGGTTHPPLATDNLPRERDVFVGRDAETSTLRLHLERSSLVTVTGPGGVGKTRLALRVARSLVDDMTSVVFCDLAEARSLDGILYAMASGLDVALGADPVTQVGHAIAARGRFLLVVDNFEQVVEHAAATIGVWIERAPHAVFLVTSREPLRLRGEAVCPLDVLTLPVEESRAAIDGSEAVRLFVTRAQQSDPSFGLTDDNAATVARLVRRLDGLPLAIELAAARVRSSPPARLLNRLSKRFDLLTGSSRDVADRQRSLRATLDWSWEQLGPTLQHALAQLSVFEGGWTLDAAELIVQLEAGVVEDALAELVDRSLVRMTGSTATGQPRFGMLASVSEYAGEKLRGLEAAHGEAELRHGVWFARFGTSEAIESLYVHGGVARSAALIAELDNLVAACARAVIRNDGAAAAPLLEAAWTALQMRGPCVVGAALAEKVLGLSSLSPRDRASTRFVLGAALHRAGRGSESRTRLEEALSALREVGDRRREGFVLTNLGILDREQGRTDDAREHLDAALAAAREVGDRRWEATVLGNLGNLHNDQGRADASREYYDGALPLVREVGDRRGEGVLLANLGVMHREQGRLDVARAHYEAALAVAREVGTRRFESVVLTNLGEVHYEQGRMDEAQEYYEAALALARQVGNRKSEAMVLGYLGNLLRLRGEHGRAVKYLNDALATDREIGFTYGQQYCLTVLAVSEIDVGHHDDALALALEAVAVAAPFPKVQALSFQTLGRVHLARGDVAAARDAVACARALVPQPNAELAAVDALVAAAAGNRAAAEVALAEATADPAMCLPGTEVAHLVSQARSALQSLAGGASSP